MRHEPVKTRHELSKTRREISENPSSYKAALLGRKNQWEGSLWATSGFFVLVLAALACLITFYRTQVSMDTFDREFYRRRGMTYLLLQTKHHLEKSALSCSLGISSKDEAFLESCLKYSDAAGSQMAGQDVAVLEVGPLARKVREHTTALRTLVENLSTIDEIEELAPWVRKSEVLVKDLAATEAAMGAREDTALIRRQLQTEHLFFLTAMFALIMVVCFASLLTLGWRGNRMRLRLKDAEDRRIVLDQLLEDQGHKISFSSKETALFEIGKELSLEVNTPLAAALGKFSLFRIDGNRQHLEGVEKPLWKVADKMKVFSSLHRSPVSLPERTRVDVGVLLESVLLLFEARFAQAHLEVVLPSTNEPNAKVHADRADLGRTLYILLENAFEAQLEFASESSEPKSPQMRITVEKVGANCEISVLNPSPPWEKDFEKRIFEPYFSTKQGRAGVSLATAKQTLSTWGCNLVCTPPNHGAGSSGSTAWVKFTIQLTSVL
jgi:signal transduction histidine kinase